MITRIIRYLYYTLFFLVPLIMYPFTSEIFEFNKIVTIYIATILIAALWIGEMIWEKKIIFKKTLLDLPLFIFLIVLIISTIFSIDFHTSIWGYYGRFNGGLISIFCYVILYFAFVTHFDLKSGVQLLKVSLVSSFIVMLWGLPGKFNHDLSCLVFAKQFSNGCWTDQFRPAERMFSTLGQPNWLGAYLAVHFFIALYLLIKSDENKNRFQSLLLYVYIFLNFSCTLFTRSRSALGAVVIGIILLVLWVGFLYRNIIKRVLYTSLIVFACIIIPLFLFKSGVEKIDKLLNYNFHSSSQQKPSSIDTPTVPSQGMVTESLDIRKIVWEGAIALGKKYPLVGTGPETFAYAYYFVRPQQHNLTSEWDYLYNKAHNEYLNYFATTGYLGILSYLVLIVSTCGLLVFISHRRNSLLLVMLCMSYISILITNFFGFSTTTVNLFFFILPGFLFLNNSVDEQTKDKENSISLIQKALIIGLGIYTLFLLTNVVKYWMADTYYKQSEDYSRTGDYVKAGNMLSRALALKQEHVYDDKLSYVTANIAYLVANQKESKTAQDLMNWAKKYNEISIKASPQNVLYWKTRAKNAYLFFQIDGSSRWIDEGVSSLETASKLSPTDPKIPYTLAVFYSLYVDLNKNDKELEQKSLDYVDRSIELKNNYRDAYFFKAQLLKKYGDKQHAKEILEEIVNKINPGDLEAAKELKEL